LTFPVLSVPDLTENCVTVLFGQHMLSIFNIVYSCDMGISALFFLESSGQIALISVVM